MIVSSISVFSIPPHSGFALRYGRVEPLFPLRWAWRRAIGFLGRGCAYRRDVFKIHFARATAMTRNVSRVTAVKAFFTFVAANAPRTSNLPRRIKVLILGTV